MSPVRCDVLLLIFWLCLGIQPPITSAQVGADWGEDQYAIAAQHYRQQRWTPAVGQFELFLEREPSHLRAGLAHFFLAESQVQLEEYESSLAHFQAFLDREPDHALATRALFRLGEAYYLLGRDEESIVRLEALLSQDAERQYTEFVWAYLGEMLLRQDDPSRTAAARDYLEQVLRDYPDSSLAERSTLALAQAYQRLQDLSGAEAMLSRLRTGSDPSIAEEALLALASLWIEQGRADSVVTALDDRTLQALSPRLQARAKYWRGRGEMALQHWATAAELLRESLAGLSEPRLSQAATYDAAICFWQAEDMDQAERLLVQSVTQWPDGPWAAESQFLRLQAAIRQQDRKQISDLAAEFLARFPAHRLAAQVGEVRGRAALSEGDYVTAEEQFRRLVALAVRGTEAAAVDAGVDPDESLTESARATWHYLWGLSLMGLERYEASLDAFESALALLPFRTDATLAGRPLEAWLLERMELGEGGPGLEALAGDGEIEFGGQAVAAGAEPRVRRLREQAQFARASALTRLQHWVEALEAQAELLAEQPESTFRYELWADRLRIYAATRAWAELQVAAEVARRWLAAEPDGSLPAGSPRSPAQGSLAKAWAATALAAGDHFYAEGDHTQARSWYEIASKATEPAIAEQALSGLAWAEFHTLPMAEAERTARLLLDRFVDSPRSAEVGLKLAQQYYRDGRLAEAADLVQTLLDRFPTWPRRHQLSALNGKLLAQQAGPAARQQALAAIEAAIRELDLAAGERVAAEASTPRDLWMATYLYDSAWLLQETGQADRAREQFSRIHLGYPHSRFWADATFRLAQHHFGAGQLRLAADLLEQIFQTETPEHHDTVLDEPESRGVPALTVSRRRVVREADAAGPGDTARVPAEVLSHALYLRAMIAATEKDWGRVAADSERLVREFPEHRLRWLAQYWWGEARFRQQHFSQAIDLLTDVLPRTDGQSESWVAMSHLRLAQSYGHLDRWRDALHVAEAARGRFPDFAQRYELDYLIGRALASEARFPQARAAYQQVIDSPTGKLTETAAMAQWMIGETYFHQEQFALAAEAYHRTETLYPYPQWQAAALFQAGQCYENLRRDNEARSVYRQLLREHANCTLVDRARERLEKLDERRQATNLRPPNPNNRR